MATVYLLLAVVGAVVPYAQFLPWLGEHGLDAPRLVAELSANRVGAFFGLDVLLSALALLVFVWREGTARGMRLLWLPVIATALVGVSCGLPLFLYLREKAPAPGAV